MLDLSGYAVDARVRVELDFTAVFQHPGGTSEREAVQTEADDFARAFSDPVTGDVIVASVVMLNGPAGGSPVVAFEGPLERVLGLYASFLAQAYPDEGTAFSKLGPVPEDWLREHGTVKPQL